MGTGTDDVQKRIHTFVGTPDFTNKTVWNEMRRNFFHARVHDAIASVTNCRERLTSSRLHTQLFRNAHARDLDRAKLFSKRGLIPHHGLCEKIWPGNA